MKTKQKEN